MTARAIATALRAAPKAKRINVHLNSEGGNVADALATYNTLTAHKAQVRTYVDGLALSSASLIAMAGDSVTMRRGSLMMIHNPWLLAIGDSDAMRKQANTLDKFQAAIASVYAEKTGISPSEITAVPLVLVFITDKIPGDHLLEPRKGWDLNPRYGFPYA